MKEVNVIDVYEINHIRTAEMKSNQQWSSQLWTQFMQLYFISIYHNMVIYLTKSKRLAQRKPITLIEDIGESGQ